MAKELEISNKFSEIEKTKKNIKSYFKGYYTQNADNWLSENPSANCISIRLVRLSIVRRKRLVSSKNKFAISVLQ